MNCVYKRIVCEMTFDGLQNPGTILNFLRNYSMHGSLHYRLGCEKVAAHVPYMITAWLIIPDQFYI